MIRRAVCSAFSMRTMTGFLDHMERDVGKNRTDGVDFSRFSARITLSVEENSRDQKLGQLPLIKIIVRILIVVIQS